MTKKTLFIIYSLGILCLTGCKDSVVNHGNKKINLTDASAIITETDTTFLGNVVEDITKTNTTQNTKQIVNEVIQQVDSVKEASTIADTETNDVNGTNIECKEFTVTFGLLMNQAGDHYTVTSFDKLANTKVQTNGIVNPSIEQMYFTKLKVKIGNEEFVLEDLQEYKTKPVLLLKTENVFTGDATAMQFREVNNKSILLAVDRAMRKAGKGRVELEKLPKLLAKTNSFSDAPCVVFVNAVHYKISGTKNGKKVNELIKISL
jgi:hypothetical protein